MRRARSFAFIRPPASLRPSACTENTGNLPFEGPFVLPLSNFHTLIGTLYWQQQAREDPDRYLTLTIGDVTYPGIFSPDWTQRSLPESSLVPWSRRWRLGKCLALLRPDPGPKRWAEITHRAGGSIVVLVRFGQTAAESKPVIGEGFRIRSHRVPFSLKEAVCQEIRPNQGGHGATISQARGENVEGSRILRFRNTGRMSPSTLINISTLVLQQHERQSIYVERVPTRSLAIPTIPSHSL
jgi:hypothetical protein